MDGLSFRSVLEGHFSLFLFITKEHNKDLCFLAFSYDTDEDHKKAMHEKRTHVLFNSTRVCFSLFSIRKPIID